MNLPPAQPAFATWQAVLDAPHSRFFAGRTSDTLLDRARNGAVLSPFDRGDVHPVECPRADRPVGQRQLRMIALPPQVYPAPTGTGELGLGPGMVHHFDMVMYAGDLSYQIALDDGAAPIDLAADDRDNHTVYADHVFPLTCTHAGDLDVALAKAASLRPFEVYRERFPPDGILVVCIVVLTALTFLERLIWPVGEAIFLNFQAGFFVHYVFCFFVGILAYRGDWFQRLQKAQARRWGIASLSTPTRSTAKRTRCCVSRPRPGSGQSTCNWASRNQRTSQARGGKEP